MKTALLFAGLLNGVIATSCGTDATQDSSCDECRAQNAPVAEALNQPTSNQKSADLSALQSGNNDLKKVQPGSAPEALANTNFEMNEKLQQDIATLKSNQKDNI